MKLSDTDESGGLLFDFYLISVKKGLAAKLKYGQQTYDHNNGVLSFMAPHQLLKIEKEDAPAKKRSGWLLLIHPDFIWNTALAKNIKSYEFFDYSANEALFLSAKEETTLDNIIENIQQEYHSNIDQFSKQIIITHIENLLSYAERFYNRQFITRNQDNHEILTRLEKIVTDSFTDENLLKAGIPTVQCVSEKLNISPGYLGSLLKSLTGMNTQQHIHEKLIEVAKEKLSTSNLSVSEIAYELGFEHSQSFSRIFKQKTKMSPLVFRASFN